MPRLTAILESALYVDDLDQAQRFYTDVCGLEFVSRDPKRHVFFRCGPSMLLIFDPTHTEDDIRMVNDSPIPTHGAHGPGHLAFQVAPDTRDHWRKHLQGQGITIESEVDWPGGGWSIYIRDPAGNSLEFATATLWGISS